MPPAQLYSKDFLICPWCGEQSGCRVDHLYNDKAFSNGFGPWYCDECRKGFTGKVLSPCNVEITRYETPESFSRSMALLKFSGQDGPVFFVIDHNRYDAPEESDNENQAHQRYFFEEHSCPTNWLRECVCVIKAGDCDPHGFLEFVRAIDVPPDFDVDDNENWLTLFPEAFETGPLIEGETLTQHLLTKKGQ